MADIWGLNPTDFAHIRAMMQLGKYEEHCRAQQEQGRVHRFDALGQGQAFGYNPVAVGRPYESLDAQERAEVNAQATGYLTNNFEAISAMSQETLYLGGRRVTDHVPIKTDVAAGAQSYMHRVIDRVGTGAFITTEGTDAPAAQASIRRVPVPLGYGGIDAIWTVEDVRAAMFGGFPLDAQTLNAAMEGAMKHISIVALEGDPEFTNSGYTTGLVNQPTTGVNRIGLTTLSSETWATRTAEQIIAHIRSAISAIIVRTKETMPRILSAPLHIALPTVQFDIVTTTRYGEGSDMTVDRWVSRNNPWTRRSGQPVTWSSLPELDEAGGSSADRMLVYPKGMGVLEMCHAITPQVLRIDDQGRVIVGQVEYKVGPLFVGRPGAIQAVDGI